MHATPFEGKNDIVFFYWIIGSPFVYSVGQLSSGGTHKVQVGGPGVEKGEVGFSSKWNLTQCVCRSQPYNALFKVKCIFFNNNKC